MSDVVIAGRSRWLRLVPAVPLLILAGIAIAMGGGFVAFELLGFAIVAVVQGLRRGTWLVLNHEALIVRRGRRDGRIFRWEDILEASWSRVRLGTCGPVLRTDGSPFDTPGPGVPAVVGTVYLPSAGAQAQFEAACLEHGVPYTPKLLTQIHKGQRTARQPGDHARLAARTRPSV